MLSLLNSLKSISIALIFICSISAIREFHESSTWVIHGAWGILFVFTLLDYLTVQSDLIYMKHRHNDTAENYALLQNAYVQERNMNRILCVLILIFEFGI